MQVVSKDPQQAKYEVHTESQILLERKNKFPKKGAKEKKVLF